MSHKGHKVIGSTLAILLLAVGCATTPKNEAPQRRATDYWPLAIGNSWTYRIQHGGAVQEDSVTILQRDADGFFVDSQGARLKPHAAGVFDGDRFLLRDPLAVGTKWMAVPSANALERFEITDVDFTVTVPAGVFEHCVRVQAMNKLSEVENFVGEWTYAPGVGMIQFVSRREVKGKPPAPQTEMLLLRFKLEPAT
ncbi:MAG: hypothetical protein ABIJ09_01235 [Pseudomonadota bacterium]